MRSVFLVIILSILFFHVSSSYAGSRENRESWDATYNPKSSFWTYEQVLSSARTAASHFFHEFKDNKGYRDLMNNRMKDKGKKSESLDFVESRIWKKLSKKRAHDWDNFHIKRNKHYYDDDSDAFDDSDSFSDSDGSDSDFGGSSPPVVPEPASSLLFLSGGSIFIYRRYLKRTKKAGIT